MLGLGLPTVNIKRKRRRRNQRRIDFVRLLPFDLFLRCLACVHLLTVFVVWPSLTKTKIAKLTILYAENPNPDQTVLQVWSRALKAEQSHIENWVQLNRCAPATQNQQASDASSSQ